MLQEQGRRASVLKTSSSQVPLAQQQPQAYRASVRLASVQQLSSLFPLQVQRRPEQQASQPSQTLGAP